MNLQTIKQLKQAIDNQLQVLEAILSIEKQKHAILISGKLKDFSDINQELILQLEILEKHEIERNHIMTLFIKDHKDLFEDTANISFKQVLDIIKTTEFYEDMNNLYTNSKSIVDSINYYTHTNKDLIEIALNILNISLQQEEKEIDYTKKSDAHSSRSMLLNKII